MAEFDLLVFGASGFAGRLAAKYLAKRSDAAPLALAIGGRDASKLAAVADDCELRPAIVIADSADPATVEAMVARTKVVLNFAGPFALHAEPIIAACARTGTHYLDITGETPFVREMLIKYQSMAESSGARLIPCSGFDSVPGDLLVHLALLTAQERGFTLDDMSCYYEARGGVNGGTVASLLRVAESTSVEQLYDPKMLILDPAWPAPPKPKLGPRFEPALDRWSAPFFMAPINQAVVYRSAYLRSLEPTYSEPDSAFTYEERMLVGQRMGAAQASLATGVLAAIGAVVRSHVGRQLIAMASPKPGAGPSEEVQRKGYFAAQLIGRSGGEVQVRATMEREGDPGNQITSILASESAKLAARGLFATTRTGFLTPAVAFGEALVGELRTAGFTITSEDWN